MAASSKARSPHVRGAYAVPGCTNLFAPAPQIPVPSCWCGASLAAYGCSANPIHFMESFRPLSAPVIFAPFAG